MIKNKQLVDCIRRMLDKDQETRWSMWEISDHPWLTNDGEEPPEMFIEEEVYQPSSTAVKMRGQQSQFNVALSEISSQSSDSSSDSLSSEEEIDDLLL